VQCGQGTAGDRVAQGRYSLNQSATARFHSGCQMAASYARMAANQAVDSKRKSSKKPPAWLPYFMFH
jgi:hypothetical protein